MDKSFKNIRRRSFSSYLRDLSYRFIKLKYFVMIAVAMLLEIATLILYVLNNEKIIYFDLMSASVLYGATSLIIIVLAVTSLILIKTDKSRDKRVMEQFNKFKSNYSKIDNENSYEIDSLVRKFDGERENIEEKVNCAKEIEDKYSKYINDFSKISVPSFLKDAYNYKMYSLEKEKLFFSKFSSLKNMKKLGKINLESDLANNEFLKEMDAIEKKLKIII